MLGAREDVIVVGAGAIGLAAALALRAQGRQVRVIDRGRIGAATSHGNCGTVTPSHAPPLAAPGVPLRALRWMLDPRAPLYVRTRLDPVLWRWLLQFGARCNTRDWLQSTRARGALLNDSRLRLADWVHAHALECEFDTRGLDYVFGDARNFDHYAAECEALNRQGIATACIDGAGYARANPAFHDRLAGAIHFPGDAQLRPDRYTAELARVLRAQGVVIDEQKDVQGFSDDAHGVRVQVGGQALRARELVLATGPWSRDWARQLDLRVPIQPGKGYSLTWSRPAQVPQRPVVLKDHSVFVIAWREALRLGGTMEFAGADPQLRMGRLQALQQAADHYLRAPRGAQLQEQWCGWRPMSVDDVPLIGRAPAHPHVWLAAGHGMLGISMSAGTGQLIADLVCGRTPAIDPAPYRPERFR
ncbi:MULTISPECIES: FAD-dependent oxidoreductase [Stenotrophomonas maltophilia group]|uniref:FAD-dependent oxidoreductase n=1 Tax=Stenotrophomonas maltophilia group TaxID=995085 RepID=UPI0018D41B67|nr:FAD-dependent oxidoreductase [Stenotrophomonas maltophilia]HDS1301480.1 FAD-dependent oxidoreductase [Stenotrophomonas maltophilia]HDS1525162.1 FAD-dependent oxidoreductase [Stenotrophomonas maltophilia]HDS1660246.1 FAD-dependent oxidoreductase [Stenotrophomonas maltophilia]HDS1664814.1 FAD-dependent oxidoreductase [Stenotrophomonas maltophilia]